MKCSPAGSIPPGPDLIHRHQLFPGSLCMPAALRKCASHYDHAENMPGVWFNSHVQICNILSSTTTFEKYWSHSVLFSFILCDFNSKLSNPHLKNLVYRGNTELKYLHTLTSCYRDTDLFIFQIHRTNSDSSPGGHSLDYSLSTTNIFWMSCCFS